MVGFGDIYDIHDIHTIHAIHTIHDISLFNEKDYVFFFTS